MARGDIFQIRQLFISIIFIFLPICLIGCGSHEDIKKVDLSKVEETQEIQEPIGIKIGLIPEQDIRKMAYRYEPLAEYLGRKLGLKVTLIYLDNYGEVCDKFIYKQLDAAFFGSFSYALTHAKAGVEPLARPDYHGTSTYRGLIVVKEDSNIKNIKDMEGKRLALVHRATYAGYLYPLLFFKEYGVGDIERYFSKVMYASSHDKAIFAILNNEADIATPKDLVYQRVIKENPDLERKLVVLSASMPVPSNTLCVRRDLDHGLKERLKGVLLNLNNDKEAKSALESLSAVRFIETKDEDYCHLYEVIRALGIDLNTYPYYDRADIGFDRK